MPFSQDVFRGMWGYIHPQPRPHVLWVWDPVPKGRSTLRGLLAKRSPAGVLKPQELGQMSVGNGLNQGVKV